MLGRQWWRCSWRLVAPHPGASSPTLACRIATPHPHPRPSTLQDWDSWWHYYNGTTSALEGQEVCDCYRDQNSEGEWQARVVENRRYALRQPAAGGGGGGEGEGSAAAAAAATTPTNASVSYYMHWRNQWPMHGHAGFPPGGARGGSNGVMWCGGGLSEIMCGGAGAGRRDLGRWRVATPRPSPGMAAGRLRPWLGRVGR